MSGAPVIHVSPMGNVGNRAIQFMAAMALGARAGNVRYSAVGLPMFGVEHPPIEGVFPATEVVTSDAVPLARLGAALADGSVQRVDIRTYAQRMENFLPVEAYRPVLHPSGPDWVGTGPDELLCNIRQGDILDARHPDYVLIPPDFYASLVAETSLTPVFIGQLEDSPYMASLRARFPRARFLPSRGPAADFGRLLRARNIVPAISTFSWLAAWLGDAGRIFMPVLGLFNPAQNRAVDLLPLEDARFRFYHFPVHYAVTADALAESHARLRDMWRYLPAAHLRTLLERRPPAREIGAYLAAFDEPYYRATYPDIAEAIAAGALPSGRYHFEQCGFAEGRAAFALDRAWYCRTYPAAAWEIAQGDFCDPEHHWLEMGRLRGYRRAALDA